MTPTASKPRPTYKSNSCPICGDVKGKCRTFDDKPLVLCMTADFAPGWKAFGSTKDGLWTQFAPETNSPFNRHEWQYRQRDEKPVAVPQTMSLEERDRFYRDWLANGSLNARDRADLQRRGITDASIALSCEFGYAVPFKGLEGKYVGAQWRYAHPGEGGRYRWHNLPGGKQFPGTDEMPLAVYPVAQPTIIALIEGTGIKPMLAARRLNAITIGAAGGNHTSSPIQLKAAIAGYPGLPLVAIPDAGDVLNPHVMARHKRTAQQFPEAKFLWWGQVTKQENDIDEVSAAEIASAQLLTWEEFEAIAETFAPVPQNWLQRITQTLQRKPKPVASALALRRELAEIESKVFEYEETDRLATWQKASQQGYRYILDKSPPGTGKSHDSGLLNPSDFGTERAFYITTDRRNSTVPTLAEWPEVEARHNGLTTDPAGKRRRVKDGQAATTVANCGRTDAIAILRSKNIQGADGDTVCQTCPVLKACKFSSGDGYGFKHQRRQALMANRLRIHPASLPDASEDFSYAKTVNIWDEASSSIQNSRVIAVSVADVDQLISHLACHAPQPFIQLQPLLSGLKSLLTGNQPRYGFSYHEVLKALPELDFSALDWDLLLQALQPNLSGLEPPDEIDLDQIAPKERRGLGWVKRSLIRETAQSQSEQAEILKQNVLKQWFSEFLGVLNGGIGNIRINRGELTLTLPEDRHRAVIEASKLNIFLDATSTREDLALKLGCAPDEIFVCQQGLPKLQNLTLTQVTDLGKLTQQRGEDKQRRATAIAVHYQEVDPTTRVIDFKKFETDGVWWRDSRGVNDFIKVKTLLLVGTPIANIAHLLSEYAILTQTHPTEEDAGFQAFVNRTIRAEFHQAIGRLRANRRPDEQLQIIILSDFDLGIPTNQVKASQITLEAADKWERFERAVKSAASHLKADGQKITQTAIAKLTGYSQQYLSRFWKLLLSLLETPYRESSKNPDPPPPLITALAEAIDAAINQHCDTSQQVLETIDEAFFEWLEPSQWSQLWQNLKIQTQIRIFESLALTLPADKLWELAALS